MKILLDTNMIVDVALERQPLWESSLGVLTLVNQKRLEGYISASIISDIYYIIRKEKGNELTLEFINSILSFCSIATVDEAMIRMALSLDFRDFEDGIQYSVAVIHHLEAIAARNPDDFTRVSLPIFTLDRQAFPGNE